MLELMFSMRRYRLWVVLLVGVGVLRCGQPAPTAGNGGATETTNARTVAGTVYNKDNEPAAHALIRVRADTYLPGREKLHSTDYRADSNGSFSFEAPGDTGLILEVISSGGLTRLLHAQVDDADHLGFDTVVVEPVSSVKGSLQGGGDLADVIFGIAGTERTAELLSDGSFVIDSVPVGIVDLAAYRKSVDRFVPVLDSLPVTPNGSFELGSVRFPDLDSGLIALWGFDEESGDTVRDASGNGRHLDVFEARREKGVLGNCLYFDGVDDTAAMRDTMVPSSEGTIMLWMKPDVLSPPESDRNDRIRVIYGNSSFEVTIDDSLVCNEMLAQDNSILKSVSRLSTDRWYQVVFTWNRETAASAIYLDGHLDARGTSATEVPEAVRVVLGKRAPGYPMYRGKLDEVRIYDRVLTREEIRVAYLMISDY